MGELICLKKCSGHTAGSVNWASRRSISILLPACWAKHGRTGATASAKPWISRQTVSPSIRWNCPTTRSFPKNCACWEMTKLQAKWPTGPRSARGSITPLPSWKRSVIPLPVPPLPCAILPTHVLFTETACGGVPTCLAPVSRVLATWAGRSCKI